MEGLSIGTQLSQCDEGILGKKVRFISNGLELNETDRKKRTGRAINENGEWWTKMENDERIQTSQTQNKRKKRNKLGIKNIYGRVPNSATVPETSQLMLVPFVSVVWLVCFVNDEYNENREQGRKWRIQTNRWEEGQSLYQKSWRQGKQQQKNLLWTGEYERITSS